MSVDRHWPRAWMNIISEHRWGAGIVVLFVILSSIYSLTTPVFEASDEISHYPVVQHIATTGRLPIQKPGVETLWEQEGSQPPLYYLLGAGLTFWIDTSDLETVLWRNPHAKLGIPLDPDNKNMIIHTEAEQFPWKRSVLAVHLIRFFSIGLGTVSVSLAYVLALTLWPDQPWAAVATAILMAFNPMFLFIAGSVNNDNLTILLSTWTLLLVTRILKAGLTTRRATTLSLVVALATVTKISGLTLLPLVGLTFLIYSLRTGEWHRAILSGLGLVGVWLVLGSWWYIRNLVLYDELLGLETHVAIAGGRQISLPNLRHEWYGFWVSYWALFGAVDILADLWIYRLYTIITLVGVTGLTWWGVRQICAKAWAKLLIPGMMLLQIGVVFVGVIRWTLTTYASQGRLMFPVIGAISSLLGLGFLVWIPERWRPVGVVLVGTPLLIIAATSPFRYIAPAYAMPPVVEALPESATPLNVHFGELELLGIETANVVTAPGGRVPVTLYWRANAPIVTPYSLFLHALGRNVEEIGKIDTYPGAGVLPTTRMQPGVIIQDRYALELDQQFQTPTAIRVQIGVWNRETHRVILATSADGVPLNSVIVLAGVAITDGTSHKEPDNTLDALFGDIANLIGYDISLGEGLALDLHWEVYSATPTDLTVFVQLVDSANEILTQGDGPPLNGDYPTSLWQPGRFVDRHVVALSRDLPAGKYRLLVGLYNANDPALTRIPVADSAGSPYPDYAVPITVSIEAGE